MLEKWTLSKEKALRMPSLDDVEEAADYCSL